MADLTDVTTVKLYGGISGSTHDAKLATLLTAASRMVERYADRQFLSGSYTEYHSGRGSGWISLNAYPISVSPRVRRAAPAMEVRNTDTTTNQRATVHVTITAPAVTLVRVASGTTTTSALSIASYATLDLLADAVDALGNGWDATVLPGYGSFATTELRTAQGMRDTLQDVGTLEVFEDFSGFSRCELDTGTLWGCFPEGTHNIRVDYTGGYSSIPEDVIVATCELTLAMHRMGTRDATLKSEKLGDYQYTNFDNAAAAMGAGGLAGISPLAAQLLAPFRRVRAL